MTSSLTEVAFACALTEEIYRRASSDQPLLLSEIGGVARRLEFDPQNLFIDRRDDEGYYYSPRGFVGRVVEKDGKFYVVLRGTDSSEGFLEGAAKALAAMKSQTALDPEAKSDLGDWANNILMGQGTGLYCQADDAIALTRAAIEQLAGAPPALGCRL